jgi:tRNA acetyltransferase TAN1
VVVGLIRDFNLIATSEIHSHSEACSELWMLLRAVGDETPAVDRSRVRGLITARTELDPVEAIWKLRTELHRDPDRFRVLLRVMPMEAVVRTDMNAIADTAHMLASRIGEDESFRVTLEKRRTGLRSREVIDAVAEGIERRVNLENPDWVVLVEIIGNYTGVSVVRPKGLLNVQKERAGLPAKG